MRINEIFDTHFDTSISHITDNSIQADTDSLFLAFSTDKAKNLAHCQQALTQGAFVCSTFDFELGERFFYTASLADILEKLYPKKDKVKLIGITGTNGKTSVAYILYQALNALGKQAAFIGTLGIGRVDELNYTGYTTPPALLLHQTIHSLSREGYDLIVMEVSSHSIAQGRILGLRFEHSVLTNITSEHLDYHGTIESYAETKLRLLTDFSKHKHINVSDPIISSLAPRDSYTHTFSLSSGDIHISSRENNKFLLVVDGKSLDNQIDFPWIGDFYISNFLACLSVLRASFSSSSIDDLSKILLCSKLPKGRMDRVPNDKGFEIIIDFAHTPDALKNLLTAVKSHYGARDIIVIFGCGGNRDKTKRPLMGEIASRLATNVIITNDNPRYEDPSQIATEILSGIKNPANVAVELDRAKAISLAIDRYSDSVIVIAGKGHEETQEINGISTKFSDYEEVRKFI